MQDATGLGIAVAVAAGPMGVVSGLMGAWIMKVAVSTDKKKKKDEG